MVCYWIHLDGNISWLKPEGLHSSRAILRVFIGVYICTYLPGKDTCISSIYWIWLQYSLAWVTNAYLTVRKLRLRPKERQAQPRNTFSKLVWTLQYIHPWNILDQTCFGHSRSFLFEPLNHRFSFWTTCISELLNASYLLYKLYFVYWSEQL